MPINFDSLPSSVAPAIIPKGAYYGEIEKAEMKTPKTKPGEAQKPDYLNIMFKLKNAKGESMGAMWDIISESNNQYAQYKLRRFVIALGITITPGMSLELKDLVKIAPHAKMIVEVAIDEKSTPNKNQVDIFAGDIYYPMSEANKVFGEENLFIDASDAEDVFPQEGANTEMGEIEY